MNRVLRAAVAQLGPIQKREGRAVAVARMINLLERAASQGANLVVFPELALTTFFPRWRFDDQQSVDAWFERAMPSAATLPLFQAAKRHRVGFYLGYAELVETEDGQRHFNSSVLVNGSGRVVGKYRKVHLPGTRDALPDAPFQHLEKRYFDVGDLGFPVWRAFDTVVGMCICNDRRWPETFRVMALKGAEIVLLGYNTPDQNVFHEEPPHLRMFHHLLSLQSSAYQNGMWILAAAKAGSEDGFGMIGGSCIVAPTGEIVASAYTQADELLVADCDLDLGAYIRQTVFNFEEHRRIEHYGVITSQTGVRLKTEN